MIPESPQSHGPTYPLGMNMLQDPLPKRKAYPGQIQPFSSRSSLGLVLLLDPVSTWCPGPWSIGSGPVHMDLVHLSHCHTESDGVFGVLVEPFFPMVQQPAFCLPTGQACCFTGTVSTQATVHHQVGLFFVIKKIIWDFGLNTMLLMPMLTALLPPPCFTHTVFGLGVIL